MRVFATYILFLICLSVVSQTKDVGIYYGTVPYSRTYHLKNANCVVIQTTFHSKSKISIGASVFFGDAHLTTLSYDTKTKYNVQTVSIQEGGKVVSSFSGNQLGLGCSVYYQVIKRQKYLFSPGLSTSLSFFTRAHAEYGTLLVGYNSSGNYYSVQKTSTTINCDNLLDKKPDIFLVNLAVRNQFIVSKQLSIVLEPFVSAMGVLKTKLYTFPTAGANVGLAWKL